MKNLVHPCLRALSMAIVVVFAGASNGPFALKTAAAQSEASALVSVLPIASVMVASVGVAGVAGASVSAPLVLSVAGTVLVVKTIEVTVRGTVYVLERASDGARFSVELSGRAVGGASMAAGTVVTVSVISAGVILSAAGEAIAFVPNALGRALLHNEQVTK
jgi:hypothetical protein